MLEKFGLEFQIVNTEYVRQLRRQRDIAGNNNIAFVVPAQLRTRLLRHLTELNKAQCEKGRELSVA